MGLPRRRWSGDVGAVEGTRQQGPTSISGLHASSEVSHPGEQGFLSQLVHPPRGFWGGVDVFPFQASRNQEKQRLCHARSAANKFQVVSSNIPHLNTTAA